MPIITDPISQLLEARGLVTAEQLQEIADEHQAERQADA